LNGRRQFAVGSVTIGDKATVRHHQLQLILVSSGGKV
jgi:hypothetical protein